MTIKSWTIVHCLRRLSSVTILVVLLVLVLILASQTMTTKAQATTSIGTDTITSDSGEQITSLSWQHQVGNAPNTVLVVSIGSTAGSVSSRAVNHALSVTYNNTPLTLAVSGNCYQNKCGSDIWYLVAPQQGKHSIVVTLQSSGNAVAGAVSYYNVDQTHPLGNTATNNGNTATPTVSLTTTSNQLAIDSVTFDQYPTQLTAGSGQTTLWSLSTPTEHTPAGGSYLPQGNNGPVYFGWTASGYGNNSLEWADVAAALNPISNTISGTVFVDSNHNGVKDAGEKGYQGATVTLSGGTYSGPTPTPPPPIGVDNTSQATTGGPVTNGFSFTINVGNHSNRLLVVSANYVPAYGWFDATDNGIAMNQLQIPIFCYADCDESIWYILNPPAGQNTIYVSSGSQAASITAGAISFYNVNQTTPFGGQSWNGQDYLHQRSGPTVTLNGTTTSQLVFDTLVTDTTGTVTPGASQTLQWNQQTTGSTDAGSTKPGGAGSTTLSWMLSNSNAWIEYAFAVNPLSTPPPPTCSSGTTTTDANGNYAFSNLVACNGYTVTFSIPSGYTATTPTSATVNVPPNATVNCGISQFYGISGTLYTDANKNKHFDTGTETGYTDGAITISITGPVSTSTTTNTGAYTFGSLQPGTYTVSLTSSLPSGYQLTYPKTIPPPSFQVTIGPACTTGGVNDAVCTNGSISSLDFGITNSLPWMQLIDLDGRNDNGFTNPIPATANPACGAYASTQDSAGQTPGIIFTGDADPTFGQGSASTTHWVVGGVQYPEVFTSGPLVTSYQSLLTKAQAGGITPTAMTTLSGCTNLNMCTLPPNLAHGIYQANGDLTLNGYTFPANQNYIFLINGSLTLMGNIVVPNGSTVIFSTSQDIIVNKGVTAASDVCPVPSGQLQGVFSADRNFTVQGINDCTVGKDTMLNVEGEIITNAARQGGTLLNQRDLCQDNLAYPSLTIKARPDFLLNFPQFTLQHSTTTQEVAP